MKDFMANRQVKNDYIQKEKMGVEGRRVLLTYTRRLK